MTLREIKMIAPCDIELELWNVIDDNGEYPNGEKYTRLDLDRNTLNKYGDYEVSIIKPICKVVGQNFDDTIISATAKLRVCIDLFD